MFEWRDGFAGSRLRGSIEREAKTKIVVAS